MSFSPINELAEQGLYSYFCTPCSSEYVAWISAHDRIIRIQPDIEYKGSLHLYTTINEKLYRWTVSLDMKVAYLRHYKEPGVPGKIPNRKSELLHVFRDNIPEITPANIKEKIQTFLIFL